MKHIEWDEDKNLQLQLERGLSFEAIIIALENGKLVDIVPNSSSNYSHQQVMVVDIDGYLVLVPFVENGEKIFLKTAFRSRKMTKSYRNRSQDDEKA